MKRFLKVLKWFLIIFVSVAVIFSVTTYFYMKQAQFGKAPTGARLERIKQSPNFRDGSFQNLVETPTLAEGYTYWDMIANMFKTFPRLRPLDSLPSIKTDLLKLPADSNVLVWFGHSSYFMQIDGRTFLVDPVFSGNASPVPGTVKAFKGSDIYTVADLPNIDYLIISHDHYDHLDYETVQGLKKKVGKVICGLGVGASFEDWGYPTNLILEKDWNESVDFGNGFKIHVTPARHFSGRGLHPANTLWASYVLQTPNFKIFVGGDGGYGPHFKTIGEKFGPIDLAILDNGQYNLAWHYVHTLPEEVLKASEELRAKRLFPVHSSKFVLANHPWDEPLKKVSRLNQGKIPLVTPIIGELVQLGNTKQEFKQWWLGIK